MALIQQFFGGSATTTLNPFFEDNGAYAQGRLTVASGNLNLAGSRPVRVVSVVPTDATGTYVAGIVFGGTLYVAGNTIANCAGGTGASRITKTGGTVVRFKRKTQTGGDLTRFNADGTVGNAEVWAGSDMVGYYTYFTVPTAPAAISITSQVGTTVNLSYSNSVSNGGSSITSYSAQYSSDGGTTWSSPAQTVSGGTFSFTNLTPGSTYTFRVYANNAAGSSAARVSTSTLIAAYGTLYRAGSFQPITTGRLYRNGAWRNITTAKVYRGGEWQNITNV